ncbi:OmpH/Skp family outer membrane protein [Spirosoma aerophilum]
MNSPVHPFRFQLHLTQTRITTCLAALILFCLNTHAQHLKVGFTRIDYIISQLPESKQVNDQLTIQQTQAENELKRLQKEFNDKYADYQSNGPKMTEPIRRDRETELQSLQTRVQEFSRTAQESLQNKYKQLMSPILSKVQQAIDSTAKQNGYHYILNMGTGGSSDILYASEENDITNLVLSRLSVVPTTTPKPSTKPTPPAPKKK